MKIVKGQKYLCVEEYKGSLTPPFIKGKIYYAIDEDWIKSETGNYLIQGSEDTFHPIEQAKWAIKRTPENAEVVNRWANENKLESDSGNYIDNDGFIHSDDVPCKITVCYKSSYQIRDGYTEIDFETFKEITGMGEEKDIEVGEWIFFLKEFDDSSIGHVAKVTEKTKDSHSKKGWVYYTPCSSLGGGFRLKDSDSNGYLLGIDYRRATPEEIAAATQQKIFTLEDVRNGKCAIENDGTVHQIRTILAYAFPESGVCANDFKYYMQSGVDSKKWVGKNYTDLPTQSVKLFLSQIGGEEQVWEVGDFVRETWDESPDKNKAYKITGIDGDRIWYNRDASAWETKYKLVLIKSKDLFSKTTTECQSGDLEEWQPKAENEFSPKWGEEVEVSNDGKYWNKRIFVALNPIEKSEYKYITAYNDGNTTWAWKYCRKPLEIHTFTTEQAKQYLAKLHNLNPEQIKITE